MVTHRITVSQIDHAIAAIRQDGLQVVTFLGYSGTGYTHPQDMMRAAEAILGAYGPREACICIGGTSPGIGAIYPLAKSMGFQTLGIVSALVMQKPEDISPHCDRLYVIDDENWGGISRGILSPTSTLMVNCSDRLVAIGGGDVTIAEIGAAKRMGKSVTEIPMPRAMPI